MTTLDPRPLADSPAPGSPADLRVEGGPVENAAVIRTVFDGERGPRRDAVILNAAAALLVGAAVDDFEAGIELARTTIDSGAAQRKLDELVAFTQAHAGPRRERLPRVARHRAPHGTAPACPRVRRRADGRAECRGDREVKRASPSQGAIAPGCEHRRHRPGYARSAPRRCRCCAPPRDFGGSLEHLTEARASSPLPALAKDFTSSPSRSPPSGWPAPTRSW